RASRARQLDGQTRVVRTTASPHDGCTAGLAPVTPDDRATSEAAAHRAAAPRGAPHAGGGGTPSRSPARVRSPKRALQPPEEAVVIAVGLGSELALEPHDLRSLLGGEPRRNADVDGDAEIATAARLERRHPAPPNDVRGAWLSARCEL